MNLCDFKNLVEENLLQTRHAHKISKNQIALRCKFCGDSKKDPNKTRFYVYINHDDDSPILYNCFNCGESGILTPSVLRIFEINNLELNSGLISFNKLSIKSANKKLRLADNKINLKIPNPKNTNLNLLKKRYIENRLGRVFNVKELLDLKVIFSLEQMLTENHINEVTCKPNMAVLLNNDYVGFSSVRNEYIIFRNITENNKYRYNKYAITHNIDNGRKFYSIPNKINIMSDEKIIINIAEGVFDILGIFYHLRNQELYNQIYVASCDSGFQSTIKYFLAQGIVGDNVVINIYSDNDHEPYFYKNLYKEIYSWVGEVHLFYNEIGKDYGVPKEKIKLIERRIT